MRLHTPHHAPTWREFWRVAWRRADQLCEDRRDFTTEAAAVAWAERHVKPGAMLVVYAVALEVSAA